MHPWLVQVSQPRMRDRETCQLYFRKMPLQSSRTHVLGSGPPRFEKTWLPTQADVQALESRLDRISSLSSVGLIPKERIASPGRYYRQYVGIVIGDRKLIYVNAFCDKPDDVVVRHGGDWRQNPIDVCDGGDCFWSAVYDPLSGEFSDLQVNGVA